MVRKLELIVPNDALRTAEDGNDLTRQMLRRTKEFAVRVIRVVAALPNTTEGGVVARQLARSGTSVGANYRACCRARSRAEFVAKMSIVIEEADETV
jgi:four helix bundle protein